MLHILLVGLASADLVSFCLKHLSRSTTVQCCHKFLCASCSPVSELTTPKTLPDFLDSSIACEFVFNLVILLSSDMHILAGLVLFSIIQLLLIFLKIYICSGLKVLKVSAFYLSFVVLVHAYFDYVALAAVWNQVIAAT